jgi:uncharacterized membrane protein YhaH (DUF805 family)
MSDFFQRYLAFDGRLARLPYFIRSIHVSLAAIVVFFAAVALFANGSPIAWWGGMALVVIAAAILTVCSLSLIVRRLHDIGLSGYHAIWIVAAELGGQALSAAPAPLQPLALASLAVLLWLQFYPGKTAENSPLANASP